MTTTEFMDACYRNNLRECERILNQNPRLVDSRDIWRDKTRLQMAAFHGYIEVCRLLLDRGANVHARESWNRSTALHLVCADANLCNNPTERLAVCELLISHGADVLCRNAANETPLHKTCGTQQSPDLVKVLLTQLWKATTRPLG